jgi:hypothetical protein
MTRRYGTVTIRGWIEDKTERYAYVQVYGTSSVVEAPVVLDTIPTGDYQVSVKYDAPAFNDGDVVGHQAGDDSTRIRREGRWFYFQQGWVRSGDTDEQIAEQIAGGRAWRVRLVPEASA